MSFYRERVGCVRQVLTVQAGTWGDQGEQNGEKGHTPHCRSKKNAEKNDRSYVLKEVWKFGEAA